MSKLFYWAQFSFPFMKSPNIKCPNSKRSVSRNLSPLLHLTSFPPYIVTFFFYICTLHFFYSSVGSLFLFIFFSTLHFQPGLSLSPPSPLPIRLIKLPISLIGEPLYFCNLSPFFVGLIHRDLPSVARPNIGPVRLWYQRLTTAVRWVQCICTV